MISGSQWSLVSFCCVAGNKQLNPKTRTHFKPFWVRLYAVAAVLATLTSSHEPDFSKAAATFKSLDGGRAAKQVRSDRKAFCQHWWEHFKEHDDLEDAKRSGRPPLISKQDALAVSAELKKGRWVQGAGKWSGKEVLVGYTSMDDAIQHCPAIKAIQERYNCTAHQLLSAAHHHDPDLGRRRVWAKHQFSDAELATRREFGKQQLAMLLKEPHYLHLLVFADESSTILHGKSKQSVQVYASKSNCAFSDICYFHDSAMEPIKAHYFLSVTAHPNFQEGEQAGLVLFDFCQGTDDIHRRHNWLPDGNAKQRDYKYQVSHSADAISMLPITSHLMCACGIICCTAVT